MPCARSKTDAYLKDIKDNNHPFSIEERKWAAEAVADCYKRIENGRLQWPTNANEVKKLHTKQLERLLSGWAVESSIRQTKPPKYTSYQRQ